MRVFIVLAALLGLSAVGLGAYGAHGLTAFASERYLQLWQTAVHYQAIHSLSILAVAILALWQPGRLLTWAAACMVLGVLMFSGSLYAIVLMNVHDLGMITPIGGTLLMIGWLLLAIGAFGLKQRLPSI
ncbi:DUF423 domain-containing protein [Brackiella oedipodis]|uniref:DUF423 domain-containing protein n=1 Tax=Brackiella oedipodis TaxID=124225 RepID=UPI00056F4C42|nr:DUF423 domain-containing protein [Brackiella oedipodis]